MSDTNFQMLVESFMEHAKKQDQEIVDGGVFIFLPKDGGATDASLFSWVSDSSNKTATDVWHDSYMAMLFALLKTGANAAMLHQATDYASSLAERLTANLRDGMFDEETVN